MDMVLPGKNGVQATKDIIEKHRRVQIIAMSTLPDTQLQAAALKAGCLMFLSKPFLKKDILQALNSLRPKNLKLAEGG
jgi:DNA-binding NarL/FixJ family response regulator